MPDDEDDYWRWTQRMGPPFGPPMEIEHNERKSPMSDDHEIRELRFRLKLANRAMGRQGQTIAALRGELARTREEHAKLERGELRKLERTVPELLDRVVHLTQRTTEQDEYITTLQDKLDADEVE